MCIELNFYKIYMAIHLITIIALFLIGAKVIYCKPSRLQVANMLLIICALFFTVACYLEMSAANTEVVNATVKMEYVGMAGMLMSYTWFIEEYSGRRLGKWIYRTEGIFSVFALLCIFGLEKNSLFFHTVKSVRYMNHFSIEVEPGILYCCFYIYFFLVFALSAYVCHETIREREGEEKRRGVFILCGMFLPFLCAVIKFVNPNMEYNLYTIGILGFLIFFSIAVNHADFLDSVQTDLERDALTGLNDRGYFEDKVQHNLDNHRNGSIIMLDMDDFKYINDHYGHQMGDKVLATMGKALLESMRPEDCACRFGGDEFCLYLAGITDKKKIAGILEELKSDYHAKLKKQGVLLNPSVSMGVAVYTGRQKESFEGFYEKADKALYLVKNSEKGKCKFYE